MARRRGRITVQHQPTVAARVMQRLMGVVHAVFGAVFAIIGLTEILPNTGLFALPFIAAGLFFCINGIRLAVSKNDVAHRVGYDVETDLDRSIVGLMEEPPAAKEDDHSHTPTAYSYDGCAVRKRLEQLGTLKSAGLITKEEYNEKRREILAEL